MNFEARNPTSECPRYEIAAYLDGDLDAGRELEIELHFADCAACRAELNEQKRLLFALDGALDDEPSIEIPNDFAKVVAAKAESQVEGLRCPVERGRALIVSSILLLLVLFGLGANASADLGFIASAGERLIAVGAFFAHVVSDLAVAASVILRSFCVQFVYKSAISAAVFVIAGILSAVLVSRILRHTRF